MAHVLVTGGHGFLGSHLVRALAARGDRVRILARRSSAGRLTEAATPAAEVVWGDVRDAGAVGRAVEGVEIVIHTVSNFRRGGSDRAEARSINVEGTLVVARAAADRGVRQLVHCSTIGVHGDVRQIPADEEAPFRPGDLYQQTKLEAEREVRALAAERGLPLTIVRPISLYGPGDRRMLKLFKLIRRRRFVMLGPGTALFQPAYIDDVVRGFLLCAGNERAHDETFIIGGEESMPLNELVRSVAGELGVAPPRLHLPLAPFEALAGVCEWVCTPLGLEPPLHRRRVSFFRNNRAFSIAKARRVLGFEPEVTLRRGLRQTIRWYEAHGWL